MFFLRRTRPLRLAAGRLRALRLSLNTPVVATQDLPVGPARAAIALHTEPGRGLQVTVGVRSLACGSVALYGFEGEIASRLLSEAMDGALSFAEGMGFLFDDDDGRGRCGLAGEGAACAGARRSVTAARVSRLRPSPMPSPIPRR